jgi:hypothetical protein
MRREEVVAVVIGVVVGLAFAFVLFTVLDVL